MKKNAAPRRGCGVFVCGPAIDSRPSAGGGPPEQANPRTADQRNTTVFVPFSTTRCSTCHFTARASVTHSTSRPIAVN